MAAAFVLPTVAILLVFRFWPLAEAARLSGSAWDGFSDPTWIGADNFTRMLSDSTFRTALLNNLKLILVMPIWVLGPLLVAQALHARIPGWRLFRFVFFLPAVLSPVVLGVYYGLVLRLDGPGNDLLRAVGLGSITRDWLNEPAAAFPIVAGVLVWSTFGIGVLIYLAGLSTLDREVLEAASVDGASGFQTQRHIVFWLMMPVIRFWTLIIFIAAFTGVFPLVFSLTRGGPGFATYVVEFAIYQEAFSTGSLGYASAVGIFLLGFVAVCLALITWLLRDRVD